MTKRTRTRSGCLSCRSRKRKCDGLRPSCSYCRSRGEDCCYGMKASFHPSRELHLSSEECAALLVSEQERGGSHSIATSFVDNTLQIAREYETSIAATPPTISGPNGDINSRSTTSTGEFEGGATYEDATEPNPPPEPPGAPAIETGNRLSVPSCPLGQGSFVAPAYFDLELPVPGPDQIHLIRAFLQNTGKWCEATDSGRHFTVARVHSLMEKKPFAAIAMALASRQEDAVRSTPREITLSLYQYAVQSLLHYEPSQCGDTTLVCCVLLSVYEMMTHETAAAEWRRHLKGCVFNLKNKGWNGSNGALVGAAFWAFARIDVWASYLLRDQTLLAPENWTDDWTPASNLASGILEDRCNFPTFVLAKIVNFRARKTPCVEGLAGTTEADALWLDLQDWYGYRSHQLLPLMRTDPDRGCPFPTILLTDDASVCGHMMFHAGCMLLLGMDRITLGSPEFSAETLDPVWHAKELCGISMTNVSHTGWINSVFPLYIAGLMFSITDSEDNSEQHAAEKFTLLKHLARIERETGWPTSSKAAELRKRWSLG